MSRDEVWQRTFHAVCDTLFDESAHGCYARTGSDTYYGRRLVGWDRYDTLLDSYLKLIACREV